MSDTIDDFRSLAGLARDEREKRREAVPKILEDANIGFASFNEDRHLIIDSPFDTVDFWPGTGLYIWRKTKKRSNGVQNLIKEIKK